MIVCPVGVCCYTPWGVLLHPCKVLVGLAGSTADLPVFRVESLICPFVVVTCLCLFIYMPRNRNNRPRFPRRSSGRGQRPSPLRRFTNMQPYTFRLSQVNAVASDGSGICAGFIFNDPTSTLGNFSEHVNYLANLFTEYRIIRSRFTLVSQISGVASETKLTANPTLAVGIWTRTPSSLPTITSQNQVLDNQPSRLWNVAADTSPHGFRMSARFSTVNYQLVTTTSTDYAGAPGGLFFYGGSFPLSQECFVVQSEIILQYRARS